MADQKRYEMMVMIKPDLTQKQTEEQMNVIRDFITSVGGEIFQEDIIGTRKLAYKVQKFDQAFYGILYFHIDAKELKELNRNINLEQGVMRHMVVSLDANHEILPFESYEFKEPQTKSTFKSSPRKSYKDKKDFRKGKEGDKKDSAEKADKKEAKAPAAKAEKAEKKETKAAPKKAAKVEKGDKIEEIDEKLQSIVDNPDSIEI